jgi:hypothetical protein
LPSPTAQTLPPDDTATPLKKLARPCPPSRLGLGICRHVFPFQCRIKVSPLPLLVEPTAQALVGEVAVTPERVPAVLGICRHVFPFQCRINVSPLFVEPTAQALVGEVAVTPERVPAALGICRHVFPFRCRINVFKFGASPLQPTAQALVSEVAATLRSSAPGGLGLGTGFQLAPFQERVSVFVSGMSPE